MGTVRPKSLGLFGVIGLRNWACRNGWVPPDGRVEGAKLDGHVAPLVVDRIAAIGAGSVRPIACGDQHRPRRWDQAGDRDRTNGRDRLGKRDDGNVILPPEERIPTKFGSGRNW